MKNFCNESNYKCIVPEMISYCNIKNCLVADPKSDQGETETTTEESSAMPTGKAVALYDFKGESEGDLSLKVGRLSNLCYILPKVHYIRGKNNMQQTVTFITG